MHEKFTKGLKLHSGLYCFVQAKLISKTMNADRKNIVAQAPTGMSLMELLVVLAIIAILAGTALVYINTDGYRLRAEANNLKSTLQEARMEAVKRNESVKVVLNPEWYRVEMSNDPNDVLVNYSLPENIGLHCKDMGELTTNSITLGSLGTASNSHIKIGSNNKNYSLFVNSAGRIILDGPHNKNE